VIKTLEDRKIVRLRALIVLPTRDLVVQVRETLESLAKGTGLVVSVPASRQHARR
jgi:ATP-dependent RNA helicase DDX51/DBP6